MINPDLPKVERCRFIRLTRADGRARRRRRTEEAQLLSSLFFSSKKTFFSREFLLIIINVHIITVQLTYFFSKIHIVRHSVHSLLLLFLRASNMLSHFYVFDFFGFLFSLSISNKKNLKFYLFKSHWNVPFPICSTTTFKAFRIFPHLNPLWLETTQNTIIYSSRSAVVVVRIYQKMLTTKRLLFICEVCRVFQKVWNANGLIGSSSKRTQSKKSTWKST